MKNIKFLSIFGLLVASLFIFSQKANAFSCSLSFSSPHGSYIVVGDRVTWTLSSSFSGGRSYWFGTKDGVTDVNAVDTTFGNPFSWFTDPYEADTPGNYTRSVQVNDVNGNFICRTADVSVSVVSTPAVAVSVLPASLNFLMQAGGTLPQSQWLSFNVSPDQIISWTARTSATWLANWLTVAPSGSARTGGGTSAVINQNAVSLPAGTYTDAIIISGNFQSQTIPVTLTVQSVTPPTPTATDSDHSPDYTYGITNSITPASNPDLFVAGVGKGNYVGSSSPCLYGTEPNPTYCKPTSDAYTTYYDHCASSTQLNEAFVNSSGKLGAYGAQAPSGYVCSNGAFIMTQAPTPTPDDLLVGIGLNSPAGRSVSPGTANVNFTEITLQALTKNIIINQISVGSDSTNAADSFSRVSVYDEATYLGSTTLSNYDYRSRWGSVNISPITIPAGSRKTITLKGDLTNNATGSLRLGIVGLAYPVSTPYNVMGLPLFGWDTTVTSGTPTPSITVLSPNGGENWTKGETRNITWQGGYQDFSDGIQLISVSDYVPGQISNYAYYELKRRENNSGGVNSFSWVVGDVDCPACATRVQGIPPGQYVVRIIRSNASTGAVVYYDDSNAPFTIAVAGTNQPSVINVLPSGSTFIQGEGANIPLSWTVNNAPAGATVYLRLLSPGVRDILGGLNNGSDCSTGGNASALPISVGNYRWDGLIVCSNWQAHSVNPGSYRIGVQIYSGNNMIGTGESNAPFSIVSEITPTPTPTPSPTSYNFQRLAKRLANGAVVKASSDGSLWQIKRSGSQLFRRWIDRKILPYVRPYPRTIKKIPADVLNQIPESELIQINDDVYQLTNIMVPGQKAIKRLVPDEETFAAMGFDWEGVFGITKKEFNYYLMGDPLPSQAANPPEESLNNNRPLMANLSEVMLRFLGKWLH